MYMGRLYITNKNFVYPFTNSTNSIKNNCFSGWLDGWLIDWCTGWSFLSEGSNTGPRDYTCNCYTVEPCHSLLTWTKMMMRWFE